MPITNGDRRQIRILWAGAGLYFLILLNGLRYFGRLPYQVVILGAALNAMIFSMFIMTIRKVRKRTRTEGKGINLTAAPATTSEAKPQNVRGLWVAAGLYFAAMLVAVQYASKVPHQLSVPGAVLNMAIVLVFVIKLRKAYTNTGSRSRT
jgi:hypothetical protein